MSAALVKELRELTGAGIMDCKRALDDTGGDIPRAAELLRTQGLAKAERKLDRQAGEGLIEAYIHTGGRIGSLIELNCETDFVARTDDFKALAHDIAMQAAAMPPRFISIDEVTDADREAGIQEYGDEQQFITSEVFLAQPYIRQHSMTIEDVIREAIAKLGENIVIRRVSRFEVGEITSNENDDN